MSLADFLQILKSPKTAFCAKFCQNRHRRCPAADLRHLLRCKGECVKITLLALPGGSRGADHRGRQSLEFRRLHPADTATPFCHQVRRGGGSDSNILNIPLRQTGAAVHWKK